MALNLDAIKARLESMNQSSNDNREETRKKFWTPPVGKSTIRVVPSMYNQDDVATELQFHTKLSKFPVLTLNNFHKQDPVEDFRALLREKGGKDNWSLNGKLSPSSRYMVPVIVRGEEDKGVRIWSVGVQMYKTLLQMFADDEIGDYTDVANGRDLKVNKTAGTPTTFPETSINVSMKTSPLSEDAAEVEKWLNEQPEPIKLFREPDYEYLKKLLETYLNGGINPNPSPATVVAESTVVQQVTNEKPAANFENTTTPEVPKAEKKVSVKSNVVQQFDDLFGDTESSKSTDDSDDLPWD